MAMADSEISDLFENPILKVLDAEQRRTLLEFKESNVEKKMELIDYYRFLKATEWDVPAAQKQFDSSWDFREEHKKWIFTEEGKIAADPDEEQFSALSEHAYYGFDKEGRPIYIEKSGRVKVHDMMRELGAEKIVNRHIRHCEIIIQRIKEQRKRGHCVNNHIAILDLTDLSVNPLKHKNVFGVFSKVSQIDSDFYPELLHKVFVINAPWMFTMFWYAIRRLLASETQKKWTVLGKNFSETLLEHIDASSLPEEYGGTCDIEVAMPTLNYNDAIFPTVNGLHHGGETPKAPPKEENKEVLPLPKN